MNHWLRANGFLLVLLVGIVVTGLGILRGDWVLAALGLITVLVGGNATPLKSAESPLLKVRWSDAYERTVERLKKHEREGTLTGDAVIVRPEPAKLRIETFPPTVTVEPVSPEKVEHLRTVEDFADAVADSIRIVGSGNVVAPPPSVHGEGTVKNPDEA